MDRLTENLIEWITGSDTATVTFSQKKYINRVRKMLQKYPSMGEIVAENEDGSVTAHISLRMVHISVFGVKNPAPDAIGDDDPEIDDGR